MGNVCARDHADNGNTDTYEEPHQTDKLKAAAPIMESVPPPVRAPIEPTLVSYVAPEPVAVVDEVKIDEDAEAGDYTKCQDLNQMTAAVKRSFDSLK